MIQPKDELIRDTKISGIKKQVAYCINAAFSKGYETCFEQKKEIEARAYQQGLEDGRKQGVAIDGDKRYWAGYHAAQEDGQKIYQKGLDDAWSAARKLFSDMSEKEIEAIFPNEWNNGGFRALIELKPQEAIEKIRAYEAKREEPQDDEIKIGDEVIYDGRAGVVDTEPYHLGVDRELFVSIWFGGCMASAALANVKKTGRHFDGIEDALKQMSRFSPPGSGDGKPCTMCPAEGKVEL